MAHPGPSVGHLLEAWHLLVVGTSSMLDPNLEIWQGVQCGGPQVCSFIPHWLVSLKGSRKLPHVTQEGFIKALHLVYCSHEMLWHGVPL